MSDHIAHLGICDDVFRLAGMLPGLEPAFKAAMVEQREMAHMGAITRYADKWTVQLIRHAADEMDKPEADRDANVRPKLAFTLGSLTHRAADRLTKPITKCWQGVDASGVGSEANESKIIQDVFVYREVYDSGKADELNLFSPLTLDLQDKLPGVASTEALFRTLLRRALIAMHTFNPDPENIHTWMDRFFQGIQQYPKSLEQYAKLHRDWDPALVKKYLTDKNFYQREDPLIQLARRIQHGESVEASAVVNAHEASDADHDTQRSRYERSLAKALDYLQAADDWYHRRIDQDEVTRRFDIGVPELSLRD